MRRFGRQCGTGTVVVTLVRRNREAIARARRASPVRWPAAAEECWTARRSSSDEQQARLEIQLTIALEADRRDPHRQSCG